MVVRAEPPRPPLHPSTTRWIFRRLRRIRRLPRRPVLLELPLSLELRDAVHQGQREAPGPQLQRRRRRPVEARRRRDAPEADRHQPRRERGEVRRPSPRPTAPPQGQGAGARRKRTRRPEDPPDERAAFGPDSGTKTNHHRVRRRAARTSTGFERRLPCHPPGSPSTSGGRRGAAPRAELAVAGPPRSAAAAACRGTAFAARLPRRRRREGGEDGDRAGGGRGGSFGSSPRGRNAPLGGTAGGRPSSKHHAFFDYEEDPSSVTLLFEVMDTGVGIAPRDAARLFTAFTQAGPRPRTRRQGVTRLGLAISMRLVRLMGGACAVPSRAGARRSCACVHRQGGPTRSPGMGGWAGVGGRRRSWRRRDGRGGRRPNSTGRGDNNVAADAAYLDQSIVQPGGASAASPRHSENRAPSTVASTIRGGGVFVDVFYRRRGAARAREGDVST